MEDTIVLTNQIENKPVGWLRKYIPTLEDLGHCLRLQCYCERISDEGLVISVASKSIDSNPVIKPNSVGRQRAFISYPDGEFVSLKESRKEHTFRVLTYNCLAEIYTSESLYTNCPDWALSWTYRRHNLLREILAYDADIMCLQEIQADHYEAHLKPAFIRNGYDGVYKVKSREAMGQRGKMDGCATLWKRDLFQLREQFAIDFNSAACMRYFSNPLALNRLMKGNIALVTILDFLDGGGSLCIVNIHIYWDPEQTDVKLFQVNVLMEELEAYLSQIEPYTPLIIGGDFNSTPDSTIYELMSTGTVSGEREDIQRDPLGLIAQMRLHHELNLQSAYSVCGNEPKYTNYTDNFVGVLDYIWYTPLQLSVTALLEVPSEADIVSPTEPSLPNHFWSSDHIALMTEFRRIIKE
ncbi:Carbon catabolite repressor protein 4 homolog 1 [Galdieria sulphuraria]|nr:Carbon catabolite repressor protein 4 homolog 1 [Galdieria sulphuraria]